ncbi:hypothetical protein BDW74DRAFT_174079 [Aspergillus multicolor]|uniref:uncharacterized protein n=1 Tax=Aspergillus multicolor TaxID=41759 RepID=UPI003CCE3053
MAAINSSNLGQVHHSIAAGEISKTITLNSIDDLQNLLWNWADAKGKSRNFVGEVQLIAELVRTLRIHQPETLLETLDRVYTLSRKAMEDADFRRELYGPLPPTLATYMMGELARSTEVNERLREELELRDGDDLLRYKIKTIRDTFLWLDELMGSQRDWVEKLTLDNDNDKQVEDRVRMRLRWLISGQAREFCEQSPLARPLTGNEKFGLENLWRLFEARGEEWLPIQCAFCLARLDPERNWENAWPGMLRVIDTLQ